MYPEVTAFIKHLLATEWESYSPEDINWGNCDSFAGDLESEFPQGTAYWGDNIPHEFNPSIHEPELHCFFCYEGEDSQGEPYYYDSECPDGVPSPVELPFFVRQVEERKQLTFPEICDTVLA